MNRVAFGLLLSLSFFPSGLLSSEPAYAAMSKVERELRHVQEIWYGSGKVVVGKLEGTKGLKISSRTPIASDGSFCTPLYPKKEIHFYAHGYDPIVVSKLRRVKRQVYDAGTLSFQKTKDEELRSVRFRVTGPIADNAQIQCSLILYNHSYLWDDHGFAGGAFPWVTVEEKTVKPQDEVVFHGLSDLPYQLAIKSNGFVSEIVKLDQTEERALSLGEIRLLAAPEVIFKYQSRVRQNGGKWKELDNIRMQEVVCNGSAQLMFSDEKDGLGNDLSLRLKVDGQDVEASFFYFRKKRFVDLGKWEGSEFPAWEQAEAAREKKGSSDILLKSKHLYYFAIDEINGTEIQLFFSPEFNNGK